MCIYIYTCSYICSSELRRAFHLSGKKRRAHNARGSPALSIQLYFALFYIPAHRHTQHPLSVFFSLPFSIPLPQFFVLSFFSPRRGVYALYASTRILSLFFYICFFFLLSHRVFGNDFTGYVQAHTLLPPPFSLSVLCHFLISNLIVLSFILFFMNLCQKIYH